MSTVEIAVTRAMALALRELLPRGAWSTWPADVDLVRLTLTKDAARQAQRVLDALASRIGDALLAVTPVPAPQPPSRRWVCPRCSDPECDDLSCYATAYADDPRELVDAICALEPPPRDEALADLTAELDREAQAERYQR